MAAAVTDLDRFADTLAGVQPARHPLTDAQSPEFQALAKQYQLDPALMGRLMQGESAADPRAVSKKGAQGLFQLMPAVQDDYGVTDPFDPAQNVPAGMQYYRDLLKQHGGKHELALAAWNAGPATVKKYGGVPPYKETKGLIGKVLGTPGAASTDLDRLADMLAGTAAPPDIVTPPLQPAAQPTPTQRRHVPGEPSEAYPTPTPAPPVPVVPSQRPAPLAAGLAGPPTPTPGQLTFAQQATTAREAGLPPPVPPDEPLAPGLGMEYLQDIHHGLRQGAAGIAHHVKNLFGILNKVTGAIDPFPTTPGGNWLEQGQQIAGNLAQWLQVHPDVLQEAGGLDHALFRAVGAAAPQLAELIAASGVAGPTVAMAGLGALSAADQGAVAAGWEAMKGAAMSGYLKALHPLSPILRVPATGAVFGLSTLADTGDPHDALVQGLIGAGLAIPGGPGRTLREHYQRFSDWVDTKHAEYQSRADARNAPPPPSVDARMRNGFAWYRERGGTSASDVDAVAYRFQHEMGMDPTTARQTAERVRDLWVEALKDSLGVKETPGAPETPPARGPGSGPSPPPPASGPLAGGPTPRPSSGGPGGGTATPPPTSTPGGPLVIPPRPGDRLTKYTGTLYKTKAQADFALDRRNDVDATSDVVVEDPPGTWVIRSKAQIHAAEAAQGVQHLGDIGTQQSLSPDEAQWMHDIITQGGGTPGFEAPRAPSTPSDPLALPPGPRPRPSRRTTSAPQAERPEVIRIGEAGAIAPKLTQLIDQMRALGASDLEASHPDDASKALEIFRTRAQAALRHYGDTPPTQIRPLLTQLRSALKVLNQHWDTLHPGKASSAPPTLEPATPLALPPPRAQRPPPSVPPRPDVIPLGPGAPPPAPPFAPDAPELLPPSDTRPALTNDPVYQQAIMLVRTHDRASTAWLSQQMGLSTSKADALLRRMETDGFVTPAQYPQPRQVVHPLAPPMPAPAVPGPIEALFGEEPAPPASTLPQPPADVPLPPHLTGSGVRPGEDGPTYQVGQVVTFMDPETGQATEGTVQRPYVPGGPDTQVTVVVEAGPINGPGFGWARTVYIAPEAIQKTPETAPAAAIAPEKPVTAMPPAPPVEPAQNLPEPPMTRGPPPPSMPETEAERLARVGQKINEFSQAIITMIQVADTRPWTVQELATAQQLRQDAATYPIGGQHGTDTYINLLTRFRELIARQTALQAPPAPPVEPASPLRASPQEAPLAPSPSPVLPDFAQGIPAGAQVPLLRPTVEDAQRLVETAKAALAEAKTALKWNTLDPETAHADWMAMRERVHQYQQEMSPHAEGLLARQLTDLDQQITRYMGGLNLNQSPDSKAMGLLESIQKVTPGGKTPPGETRRRIAEALLARAEPLITDEWLDTKIHDQLVKAIAMLRKSLTIAQPPMAPSAPVVPSAPPIPPWTGAEADALKQAIFDAYQHRAPKMSSFIRAKNSDKLVQAMTTGTYGEILHPDNGASRRVFTDVTGVKLPGTLKGTQALFTGVPFPLKTEGVGAPPVPPPIEEATPGAPPTPPEAPTPPVPSKHPSVSDFMINGGKEPGPPPVPPKIPETAPLPEGTFGHYSTTPGIIEISPSKGPHSPWMTDLVAHGFRWGAGRRGAMWGGPDTATNRRWAHETFGARVVFYPEELPSSIASPAPAPVNPAAAFTELAKSIWYHLGSGQRIRTIADLQGLADLVYGGTRGSGAYDTRDLYDALEVGLNRYVTELARAQEILMPDVSLDTAMDQVRFLHTLMDRVPTQTVRTAEQDAFQQFSTPLDYAYAINWVANLQPGDIVLEPSAGTGTIATFARLVVGDKVHTNEIAARRLQALRDQGFPHVTSEDALFLHALLHTQLKPPPTVVVMNPPFSQSAAQHRKDTMTGAHHVEQALKLLAPGGRLVAIVGGGNERGTYRGSLGMTPESSTYRAWFAKIAKQHSIRANIRVAGDVYKKQGAPFATRVLVIDKGTPTASDSILSGDVTTIPELLRILEEVRHVRTITPSIPGAGGPSAPPAGEGAPRLDDESTRPTDAVGIAGATERPVAPPPGATAAGIGGPGRVGQPGSPSLPPAPTPRRPRSGGRAGTQRPARSESPAGRPNPPEPIARPVEQPGPVLPPSEPSPQRIPEGLTGAADLVRPLPQDPQVEPTSASPEANTADLTDAIFEPYLPQRVRVAGAQPHPGALVESAAMASVPAPHVTYTPSLPPVMLAEGRISLPQYEAVVYAGQAHQERLPSGERQGLLLGDGTGVGKGREIAAIIADNWYQGRTKALWISKSADLIGQAQRDWANVTGRDGTDIFSLAKPATAIGAPIKREEGILFLTYDTLKTADKKDATNTRMKQILEWLGADFDGAIMFDEAHLQANNMADTGGRHHKDPSQRAVAGQALREALPNARVTYLSATGATEVRNLGYLDRLGLWGPKTPFASKGDFVSQVASGGVAAMELVARDMKAMGVYMARSLSFHGVEYDRVESPLTAAQIATYDRIAIAWQGVLKRIGEALKLTDGADSRQRQNATSLFWGAHQRFFNQLITALQTPKMIERITQDLTQGHAAVIQLVNTNQATQDRRLAQMQEGDTLEDLSLSPLDILMEYVQNSFPVAQQVEVVGEDGSPHMETLLEGGQPVENPEAVALREQLLNDLAMLQADIPDGPLEQILNHFGPDAVAEVTGRPQRLVYRDNAEGQRERVRESRSNTQVLQDVKDFMNDKKQILIFSGKGDTGMDYHASLAAKNQRHRQHYLLQPGWQADKAVQGLGRTHRTNQASAPTFHLVTTDLPGQRRFISSIARRLDQLGALTRGQRQASAQGLFSERDNLESQYAKDALDRYFRDLVSGRDVHLSYEEFADQAGLTLIDTESGGMLSALPPIQQFLNRLLSFTVEGQHNVFEDFSARLDQVIELAIQQGTFDVGMETIKADRIQKVQARTIATDEKSGSETTYVELNVGVKPTPLRWEQLPLRLAAIARNRGGGTLVGYVTHHRTGKVYALVSALPHVDSKSGALIDQYRRIGVDGESLILKTEAQPETYAVIDATAAQRLWERDIAALPAYKEHPEHLITGVLLPHWDKLPGAMSKVYRLQTDEGERMIGRVIPPKDIARVLKNFGVTLEGEESPAARYTPEDAITRVLTHGSTLRLSNDWRLKPSGVGGEPRVELTGPGSAHRDELMADGVLFERLGYNARWFLPTGVNGVEVLRRLLENKTIAEEINAKKTDDAESPRAAYRPNVPRVPGQEVYEPPPGYVTRFAQSKVVDEDGALKPVYHGTPEAFQAFDPQRQDPGALYGPGHYFTEEPRIAGGRGLSDDLGYAGSGKGEVVQRFPTYRAASDYVTYTPMVTLGDKNADGQWEVRARFKNPNIRPVYLNIQQPFALDARYDVDQVSALTGRATVFGRMEGWSGHDIYTAIESDTGSKEATNHRLQDLGFDGITHIGGQNTGTPPHRVWIAFHPNQILPVYAPEVSYDRRPASSPGDLVQAEQLLLRFEAAARGDLWAASGDVGGTPPAGPGLPGVPSILGARTLGKSLPARAYIDALRSTGAAAFVGQQAKTPHDLAVLAQAVRDPNMERLFWVFMKEHEAVDTLVISSRLPGSSAMFPVTAHPGLSRADHIRLLQQRMKALGADSYWILHNHPSGDATPSTADRVMTTNIHLDMPGLRGHVVINSGHYTVIGPNGKPSRHQLPPAPDAPPLYGLDPFLEAGPSEVPHPLNSQYIRASSNLATLGQKVNAPDGYVTAFFRSATGQVRGIELIPVSIFTDTMAMEAYAANRGLHFGTSEMLTYYDGHHPQVPAVARELYARGVLRDHYAPTHAVQSLASTFPGEYASTQQPGMARGEEVTTSGAPPLWRKTG